MSDKKKKRVEMTCSANLIIFKPATQLKFFIWSRWTFFSVIHWSLSSWNHQIQGDSMCVVSFWGVYLLVIQGYHPKWDLSLFFWEESLILRQIALIITFYCQIVSFWKICWFFLLHFATCSVALLLVVKLTGSYFFNTVAWL